MTSFWTYEGKLEPSPGSNIESAVNQAIAGVISGEAPIDHKHGGFAFSFNGVEIVVAGDSDAGLILRDWRRAMAGYIKGPVGPYPVNELAAEELESDRKVEAQNEERRQRAAAEYEAKAAAKRASVEEQLANAPQPADIVSDPGAFQAWCETNSHDGYSAGVVSYAIRWMRLMDVLVSAGARLEDVADRASHEADTDGITGFMYGCAVGALACFWRDGEELRRWHNLKTQIGNEGERANESGGVLNPAVLSIG